MHHLRTLTQRLPAFSLLLSMAVATLLTSCNGRKADGSLTIFGVIYILLAIAAFLSLIKQDWSIGKKIIWGLIIWFFPFGGSIIYFLFSGRK
ncbi:PLD nuclease N-terminal domain-containing protein [Hymenobacter sp. NST-14]|uniref:PLD nuclease N-terminal domain-containing protein n=1 Tax=Hymenobacter piscis TaxID=2839984 RepID=UPI001C02FB08|nr:PLD nuclease N-terminal domain-containing protein [Hymenobacter piscis]MBT9392230.1 PLD nuclease N-terminal domain-containing protein [Hymenobacter piscis]